MTNQAKKRGRHARYLTTTIRVPHETYADFKHFAEETDNRTASHQVRHLIESYVAEKKAAA